MHELSLCRQIVKLVETELADRPAQQVKTVRLEIGDLAGIELDALRFSFPIAARGTQLAGAALAIDTIAGQAHCQRCDQDIRLAKRYDPCPQCQQYDYDIIRGDNMRVMQVELA